MIINPLHLSVAQLLHGRLFQIPDYQRPYSWQTRQRDEMFRDIEEAARTGKIHFMATVVSLAREKCTIGADEFQRVDLVDGQQRITTLVILLKAIEKRLDENDVMEAKSKRDLGELLIKHDEHSLVLLQTNHDSSDVFPKYLRKGKVDASIVTASDKNLEDAISQCEAIASVWHDDGRLIEMLSIIRNKLSMIYHELDDEATVYRVFEVLNSRGLSVKWLDKTKSQLMAAIFEHADDGARTTSLHEMQSIWKDVYRELGLSQGLGSEALKFAGTWRSRQRPNRILSEQDASSELLQSAGTELSEIADTADWIRKVVKSVIELNKNPRLTAVTKISHARFLAIAIILRDFEPEVQKDLLGHWERVTFRIFGLGGADSRNKVGDYVRLGFEVLSNCLDEDEVVSRILKLGEQFPIERVIDQKGQWKHCYDGWQEELRYLLFRYEEFLSFENDEDVNPLVWEKIWLTEPSKSIEHIQPQSSNASYIHDIGNLTMLPPGVNSSLKAKPPKEKAAKYKECGLRQTVDVGELIANQPIWTARDVAKRREQILDFVRGEWGG